MIKLEEMQAAIFALQIAVFSIFTTLLTLSFATHRAEEVFLIGLATSIGTGASMGLGLAVFSGGPFDLRKGAIGAVMATLGGLILTIPFYISDFWFALMLFLAVAVLEFILIAMFRYWFIGGSLLFVIFQVIAIAIILLATATMIGNL